MKKKNLSERNEAYIKIVVGQVLLAMVISYIWNNFYAACFMFGGCFMSLLYELMGMVRDKPKKRKEKK